ncbi:MAG: hypothetical protein DMF00_06845 [Verrucomicrobia bacterium]|nr:MAG: hypothetical protein DMF00_06845 [Verrucomicrobiota bacterium]
MLFFSGALQRPKWNQEPSRAGKIVRRFKTHSLPRSLAATLRCFTFYVVGPASSIRGFVQIEGRARSPLRAGDGRQRSAVPTMPNWVKSGTSAIFEVFFTASACSAIKMSSWFSTPRATSLFADSV